MTSPEPALRPVTDVLVEIERHVSAQGWDQGPRLFALAQAADLIKREPELAAAAGLMPVGQADSPSSSPDLNTKLVPIEQEWSPGESSLDEALALIAWPAEVVGVALAVEQLILPPTAESDIIGQGPKADSEIIDAANEHPDRQEVRLAVAVTRDGLRQTVVRMRAHDADLDVLIGPDLVVGLTEALSATLD